MSPIAELRCHLEDFSSRCLTCRWFGPRLHVGVAQDITADAEQLQRKIRDTAYSAEQADLCARELIEKVVADDLVTPDEIPDLKKALRYIVRSANADHEASELASD